ncbi:hypothetical protein TYRP_012099 [Tyrophagus putrescentiae]|nr:hypothetical protein TYRP_012099 [Tyrophagus putrescentiae]
MNSFDPLHSPQCSCCTYHILDEAIHVRGHLTGTVLTVDPANGLLEVERRAAASVTAQRQQLAEDLQLLEDLRGDGRVGVAGRLAEKGRSTGGRRTNGVVVHLKSRNQLLGDVPILGVIILGAVLHHLISQTGGRRLQLIAQLFLVIIIFRWSISLVISTVKWASTEQIVPVALDKKPRK